MLGVPTVRQTLVGRREATHKVCHAAGGRGPDQAAGPDPEDGHLGSPTARRGPGSAARAGKAPTARRCSAASLHTGTLTHARTLTHTYAHNKRKPCEPRAEVGRALPGAPPPGPGLLTEGGASAGRARKSPRPSRPAPRGRAARNAAPRRRSARCPAERRQIPPVRLSDPAWAPCFPGLTITPPYPHKIPHPYNP